MLVGALVLTMAVTLYVGITKLKAMQTDYDARRPAKVKKSEAAE